MKQILINIGLFHASFCAQKHTNYLYYIYYWPTISFLYIFDKRESFTREQLYYMYLYLYRRTPGPCLHSADYSVDRLENYEIKYKLLEILVLIMLRLSNDC